MNLDSLEIVYSTYINAEWSLMSISCCRDRRALRREEGGVQGQTQGEALSGYICTKMD